MTAIMERAHLWIDTLQTSGLSDLVVIQGIMTALIERALLAGDVSKTLEWLQGQADLVAQHGNELRAELRKRGS